MQQAVQEAKDVKNAEYEQLESRHQALAALVQTLQDTFAQQIISNGTALQVCHHSYGLQWSKLMRQQCRHAVGHVFASL